MAYIISHLFLMTIIRCFRKPVCNLHEMLRKEIKRRQIEGHTQCVRNTTKK